LTFSLGVHIFPSGATEIALIGTPEMVSGERQTKGRLPMSNTAVEHFGPVVVDSAEGGFTPGLVEIGYVAPRRRGRPSDITALADASVQLGKPVVVRASKDRFEAVKRALGLNKRFISAIDRVPQEGEDAEDGVLFVVSARLAGNGSHEDTPTEVPTDIPGETPTEVPAEAPPEVPLGAPADDVEEQVLTA
jgi:hypothetical protein